MAKTKTKARPKVEEPVEEVEDLTTDDVTADEDEDAEGTLTAKELAREFGVDGRTVRKFLRSKFGLVGQGNRWAIDRDDVEKLRSQFEAWRKPKAEDEEGEGTSKKKSKRETKVITAEDLDDEVEDLEDIEDIEDL